MVDLGGVKSFRRRAQRIVREMERNFDTGYETGYKLYLTDDVSRNLAVFDRISRFRLYALTYMLSLGVSSAAVPLVAWLHLAEAPGGTGFVTIYWALAAAAAMLLAASLLLPSRRELAALVPAETAA